MHSKNEILRSLTSDDTFCYFLYDNKKLIGYLTGEYKTLNDNRYVFYVSYFYICSSYRNKQLGSKLMKLLINKCTREGTKFILLTCDTFDNKVVQFYKKLGFVQDPILGDENKRHNVFVLYLE
jgi:GNAT superfamily N-acetyltransferase